MPQEGRSEALECIRGLGHPRLSVATEWGGFSDQTLERNVMARDVDLALAYLVSKDFV